MVLTMAKISLTYKTFAAHTPSVKSNILSKNLIHNKYQDIIFLSGFKNLMNRWKIIN
jgi:hypothetical protein